jgi:capsular exopolysaccharide synthesis family protein
LDVIPVGTIPPNPTELLNAEKIESLLSDLRKTYDYIFIDCPPIEMVADAAIINAHVDSTLFVVRAGLLNRSMLPVLQRLYDEQKYCNLNIILNGTEEVHNRYGYRRYGYRYGYNYGYGKYSTNE